jgi:hypothetical protein
MFKVGDKVKCVSNSGYLNLTDNKLYVVTNTCRFGGVYVNDDKGLPCWLWEGRFELVKPEPQAAAVAGGLQEHSVGEYYPLAAVLYEHGDERVITIENLQTGEVNAYGPYPCTWLTFEAAYARIEILNKTGEWSTTKGRVSYTCDRWVVAEPANPVRVTRLRNMLHRS